MTSSPPIGLVPAAGHARRLGPTPVSKEVLPVGMAPDGTGPSRLRVAVDPLLHAFRTAGADTAYVVLREGKWDIPAYLGTGAAYGLSLAYVVTPPTPGVPFTLDRATPFLDESRVLFGFPDILFEPSDAFVQVLEQLDRSEADLVLGLFPVRDPAKADLVDVDSSGRVRSLEIKPARTSLERTWLIAAWEPAFTQFLHEDVRRCEELDAETSRAHLGHVIEAALDAGLEVDTVVLEDAAYVDIGTPEALHAVLQSADVFQTRAPDARSGR